MSYAIQQTGSFLLGEFFAAGNYRTCLQFARTMKRHGRQGHEGIGVWASKMHEEDYHELNTYVLLAFWAAQEAGIENILAAVLANSENAAEVASTKFKADRYPIGEWPWPESTCIEIAQKLDQKSKEATKNGGVDVSSRIQNLFFWLGMILEIEEQQAQNYNEASMARNVILHRYGRLSEKDTERFPHLKSWTDAVLPITTERLNTYYNAVTAMHVAIARAVWKAGHK